MTIPGRNKRFAWILRAHIIVLEAVEGCTAALLCSFVRICILHVYELDVARGRVLSPVQIDSSGLSSRFQSLVQRLKPMRIKVVLVGACLLRLHEHRLRISIVD